MRTRCFDIILVAAGMLIAASTPAGLVGPTFGDRTSHVDLQWSQIRRGPRDPVAAAQTPNRGLVTVAMIDSYRGFSFTRSNRHGHQTWSHVWRGPGGRFRGVSANALAVSQQNHSVLAAGQATCRFQGDGLGSLGPVFVRSYDLGGDVQWTRWIGKCPTRSADRRVRALSVAGLDVWPNGIGLAFTQGHSFDCCPHFRRGHVVTFGFGGATQWRTDLTFRHRKVHEVVASDLTAASDQLVVSGSVINRRNGSDAFLIGLSMEHGSVVWRHVTTGRAGADSDAYSDVDAANGTIFATGEIDASFEGGDGRFILERWDTSGTREWRAFLPSRAMVAALPNHSVLWSGSIWKHHHRNQITFGRQRADGSSAWRQRRLLPRGDFPYDYHFVATRHHGFSVAEVDHGSRQFLQTWAWRWE